MAMCIRRRATAFPKPASKDEPTEVDNEWANHAHGKLLKLTVGYERDRHALVGTALADKSNLAQLPSNIRKGD